MIGRAVWWFSVRFLAWALRRGVTIDQAEMTLFKSFPHRDEAWRRRLLADAQARNRARTMKSIA